MRVALCISGMSRSFKQTYDTTFKHLIQKHQADVFISTWKPMMRDDAWPDTDPVEEMIDLYKPIKFDIELFDEKRQATFETNDFKSHSDQAGRAVGRMLPMYYKIYLANMHKFMYEQEHLFTYDVVIRCRSDLYFNRDVELVMPQPKTAYFPTINSQSRINDQFWFADSETSDFISRLYLAIPRLWHGGILIHGETLLGSYIELTKVNVENVDVDYYIKR